ncbi:hypothetical protein SmJEL517_g03689 [Synchytrium microbalum]|uniref:Ribosome assembly protein 1 n=1 Tax=Synchytrium microbalum TaxID=1806994 RepID=A0A507C7E1_9FUNG|nr:uncharacterized protein SmJEL517_g03689 [Synchytrium microbalum]TPX33405.1 hypothetical protein SmJEL517_g03689 [Synchytrium microbalum]
MGLITQQQLVKLQSQQGNIRNICILAHVDHGKTTLSDGLLASNGIISAKLSGKVRYLDSREDEQERGITMKSSGISLFFRHLRSVISPATSEAGLSGADDYLINLIDSPGHVDFASEVSTASRLCDGALVLVDAVEGVLTQTHTVLRQAWLENVKPILVINKIDRLITELKLTPSEAYIAMSKLLEQANAIMATFYAEDLIADDARDYEEKQKQPETTSEEDWFLEDRDDSHLYFAPEKGNVIFSSAIDGWAFRVDQFASIYAAKLGVKETTLNKVLWGDFYLDPKTKRVVGPKGLKGRSLKPMFVQFILDNLWAVYDAVLSSSSDRERVEKIVRTLNLKILARDMKSKDSKYLLQTILGQWLPLSTSILLAVVELLPSPIQAQALRIPKILYPKTTPPTVESLPPIRQKIERALYACDANNEAPVIAYVSKMFSVPTNMLPTHRRVQLTAEEMRERRREALLRREAAAVSPTPTIEDDGPAVLVINENNTDQSEHPTAEESVDVDPNAEVLIGFARVYSGTIRIGQKLHVLGPKYDPRYPNQHKSEITVSKLYLMMGRDLQDLKEVPAGNVFGIGGLDGHLLKTGTLASESETPSFGGLTMEHATILRVALEPADPTEMPKLVEGLKLLNQADPCVEVYLQETGEHVIVTAGELHLERCLKDLRERFARIQIQASPPLVPYRETISKSSALTLPEIVSSDAPADTNSNVPIAERLPPGTVIVNTPNKLASIRIRALPMPERLTRFLLNESETLRKASDDVDSDQLGLVFLDRIKNEIETAIREDQDVVGGAEFWRSAVDKLWALGPRRVGPNMLINAIPGYHRRPWLQAFRTSRTRQIVSLPQQTPEAMASPLDETAVENLAQSITSLSTSDEPTSLYPTVKDVDGSIHSGFQLSTLVGPLCGEPVVGVAWVIEECRIEKPESEDGMANLLASLSGQIISTMKEGCRQAFLQWSPRLMLAMYSCDLQAPSEVLGKVYAVLARRRGRILSEEMKEGTPFFNIKAMMPVLESFGFSDELRKRTSGAAIPQLIFSGFEVLDQDPFWVPNTEEELEDLGEKADRDNLARKYVDAVRKRKGMFVEKKIVEHAEKQRTLKKD